MTTHTHTPVEVRDIFDDPFDPPVFICQDPACFHDVRVDSKTGEVRPAPLETKLLYPLSTDRWRQSAYAFISVCLGVLLIGSFLNPALAEITAFLAPALLGFSSFAYYYANQTSTPTADLGPN